MADRYDEFERNRDRERERERERSREAGQRFEDYRREFRGEEHGQEGRDYGNERDYGREERHGIGREGGYSTESRYDAGYNRPSSEFGQRTREEWRPSNTGGYGGQRGEPGYSAQDWRTQRHRPSGVGMGDDPGRRQESWQRERGYGERREQGTYNQGMYPAGSYGQTTFGSRPFGTETDRGDIYGGQSMTGRFSGRGPKGYQRSDDRIREDVCERLTQNPEIDASEIEILVTGGEVTLTGSVEDRHQKRTAEDVIENISGVREVHNQLRVTKGIGQRVGEALGLSGNRENEENRTRTSQSRPTEPVGTRR